MTKWTMYMIKLLKQLEFKKRIFRLNKIKHVGCKKGRNNRKFKKKIIEWNRYQKWN